MNIYNAIMQAADHIESHPRQFNYSSTDIPEAPHCGTPGCAIGWTAFFAGVRSFRSMAEHYFGGDMLFYSRMNDFDGPADNWMNDPQICARNLRLYAEKYHGHEKPQPLVPNWRAMMAAPVIPEHVKSEEVA